MAKTFISNTESVRSLPKAIEFAEGLRALQRREWFQRRWVVQEFQNTLRSPGAQLVLLGDVLVYASDLAEQFKHNGLVMDSGPMRLAMDPQGGKFIGYQDPNTSVEIGHPEYNSILHLQHVYAGSISSEPHDLVYSLLGVCNDFKRFSVDYARPVESVFLDLASGLVERGQCHRVLYSAVLTQGPLRRLPSWVRDWRSAMRNNLRSGADTWLWRTTPDEDDPQARVESDRYLVVHGWICRPCGRIHDKDCFYCDFIGPDQNFVGCLVGEEEARNRDSVLYLDARCHIFVLRPLAERSPDQSLVYGLISFFHIKSAPLRRNIGAAVEVWIA